MTLREQELIERLRPHPVRYFSQIGSTNDVALEWMREGADAGALVIADEQVKGKGRLGRAWHTPPGTALILSTILRPDAAVLPQVTMLGALAIYDMVKGLGVESVGIKWPNDVLVKGLKVSGVLPETVWEGDRLQGVVLGMGINVRVDFADTDLVDKAVSIEPVLGRRVDRTAVLIDLVARVDYWTARLGRDELLAAWKDRLVTLGQTVRIVTAAQEVAGEAVDVDRDGALFVRGVDQHTERVVAGDIALG